MKTLMSLDADAPPGAELMLVRSGTDGRTPAPPAFADWLASLSRPVTVIGEPLPGLARARERGLAAARNEIVLFTDDDVEVRPGWYGALVTAMAPPEVAAAGGTILPSWPSGERPGWIHPRLATFYGERLAGPHAVHPPFGANFAVRRSAVLRAGGFRTDLGVQGTIPGLHEETELCDRLTRLGHRVAEAPGAVVVHRIDESQQHLRWILRRAWHEGLSDARRDGGLGDPGLRSAKLAGLVCLFPLALVRPRSAVYVCARAVSNTGYLWQRYAADPSPPVDPSMPHRRRTNSRQRPSRR